MDEARSHWFTPAAVTATVTPTVTATGTATAPTYLHAATGHRTVQGT